MKKTAREGVYTRKNKYGVVSYIITYTIHNKVFKRKVGCSDSGWNINRAAKERAKRISEDKVSMPKNQASKSFNEVASEYFLSISHKSDHKNTISRYKNYIESMIGEKEFRLVTVKDILELKLYLSQVVSAKTGNRLSGKSINDRLNLINTIYNYYNKVYYSNTIISPAGKDLVERYRCDNSRLRFLSKEEYYNLLAAIENRVDYTLNRNALEYRTKEMLLYTKLLVTTGMRTYSALTLRKKDFNFKDKTICVHNHKSNRIYTSFIHQSIHSELKALCDEIPSEFYIFGKRDKPYHRSTINKRLLPIMDRLYNQGVINRRERVVVHSLRHTFGSWLAQQGTSLYIISKLMDHSDISQTQVYSKLAPNSGADAVTNIL